jgi:hypothetical protein
LNGIRFIAIVPNSKQLTPLSAVGIDALHVAHVEEPAVAAVQFDAWLSQDVGRERRFAAAIRAHGVHPAVEEDIDDSGWHLASTAVSAPTSTTLALWRFRESTVCHNDDTRNRNEQEQ